MSKAKNASKNMRIWHRYLGFFLAGIMSVYAVSGIILIFRDTNFLKKEHIIEKQLEANISADSLSKALGFRRLEVISIEGNTFTFQNGTYNSNTGEAVYSIKRLPFILNQMTHIHKSKSGDPLFFLNIFFGGSLLFFVISSFWMFMPSSKMFVKCMYFTGGGVVLTLLLLFI
tara:strand:+ start:15256 stop:15771 length:516 start_codon:yes stop_codon:yes gene_type:complete